MVHSLDREIQLLRCVRVLRAGCGIPCHAVGPLGSGEAHLAADHLD